MEINFIPGEHGWIKMKIETDPSSTFQISLSNVFDSFLLLHKFFFYLANDKTGISSTRIDEEGKFVNINATPAKKPTHAKFKFKRKDEELIFFYSRKKATTIYASAFRDLLDGQDYGGFRIEVLYVAEFEKLLGNN